MESQPVPASLRSSTLSMKQLSNNFAKLSLTISTCMNIKIYVASLQHVTQIPSVWTSQPKGIYPNRNKHTYTHDTPTTVVPIRLHSTFEYSVVFPQTILYFDVLSHLWDGPKVMAYVCRIVGTLWYVVLPSIEKISYRPPLEFIYWDGYVLINCLGHTVFRKLLQIVMWNRNKRNTYQLYVL